MASKNDILNRYNITEWSKSESLEWKLSTREMKDIVVSLAAFSNTRGGVVICGVNDDGNILGQDISDATLREATQTILANTEERISANIERVEIEGKACLLFHVVGSPLKPHLAYGRAWKRMGSSNIQMEQAEYHLLLGQKRNGGGADRDLLPDASIENIDLNALAKFLELANDKRNTNFSLLADTLDQLTSLELSQGGILNKAALLCFGKNPEKYIPAAELRCALFTDSDKDEFIDKKVFTGNLFEQLNQGLNFARTHLPIGADTSKEGNRTISTIPVLIIQELLANALIHRDYNSPVSVYFNIVKNDYLEIYNPGALFKPQITPETIYLHNISIPPNRRLARIFFMAGIIEQWGAGTGRVYKYCHKNLGIDPVWTDENGIITVRLELL